MKGPANEKALARKHVACGKCCWQRVGVGPWPQQRAVWCAMPPRCWQSVPPGAAGPRTSGPAALKSWEFQAGLRMGKALSSVQAGQLATDNPPENPRFSSCRGPSQPPVGLVIPAGPGERFDCRLVLGILNPCPRIAAAPSPPRFGGRLALGSPPPPARGGAGLNGPGAGKQVHRCRQPRWRPWPRCRLHPRSCRRSGARNPWPTVGAPWPLVQPRSEAKSPRSGPAADQPRKPGGAALEASSRWEARTLQPFGAGPAPAACPASASNRPGANCLWQAQASTGAAPA